MKKFAERLKELRTQRNLSQMQLGLETGISQSSIGAWEIALSVPNAKAIIALAKYFDVSSDYLLGLSDTI